MEDIFVMPNPNRKVEGMPLKVWDPSKGDHLPAQGRRVAKSTYWRRLLRVGDVLATSNPKNDVDKAVKMLKTDQK